MQIRLFFHGLEWRRLIILGGTLLCGAMAPDPDGAGFLDPPQAIEEVDAPQTANGDASLRCYWYGDTTFIETRSGTPDTGPTILVLRKPGSARPPCVAASEAGGLPLKTDGEFLIGKKGSFLIFGETDAQGAELFYILHAPDGRMIYSDSHRSNGLKAASVASDVLHLRYVREYDAACSLPKEGATCWKKAMQAGHFSHAIAQQPPPLAACAQSYKAAKANPGYSSVITYDVEMTLTDEGKATVLSRGPVECLPPN